MLEWSLSSLLLSLSSLLVLLHDSRVSPLLVSPSSKRPLCLHSFSNGLLRLEGVGGKKRNLEGKLIKRLFRRPLPDGGGDASTEGIRSRCAELMALKKPEADKIEEAVFDDGVDGVDDDDDDDHDALPRRFIERHFASNIRSEVCNGRYH